MAAVLLSATACGRSEVLDLSSGGPIGAGGSAGSSGFAGAGGTAGSGANPGTGGAAGSGGTAGGAGTGGFSGSGGAAGTGGFAGSGGFAGTGGAIGTGGFAGTGGSGGTCTTDADCESPGFCTIAECDGGACVLVERDLDGDGFIDSRCGGTDCNDDNRLANPSRLEVCADGADNDCNGVLDCLDPACAGVPDCACVPSPERCDSGTDEDCDGLVDCADPDCIGTRACGCTPNENGLCGDGIDNDCDGAIDCDDSNCADTDFCECRSETEDCDNGADDDCDGLIDCADPDCAARGACACPPQSAPEDCDDGLDNDCDGAVDCADSDCTGSPACAECTVEICDDGVDNNCDGRIDCADSACQFAPGCDPLAEECNNGVDDDRDGLADCADPDCAQNPFCVDEQASCLTARRISASGTYTGDTFGHIGETSGSCGGDAGEAVFELVLNDPARVQLDSRGSDFDTVIYVRTGACQAGRELACDDDSGGQLTSELTLELLQPGSYFIFVDGFTVDAVLGPNEGNFALNVDIDDNPSEVCDDGVDNDGDIFADCADSDCTATPGCAGCNGGQDPEPEFGPAACTDGLDNDCDGLVDCADDDCSASETQVTECCNGRDQNGNGIADDFNCRCASDADCPAGQICYTRSANACSIPCERFVGDVCPFQAPGSTCSEATGQCEF